MAKDFARPFYDSMAWRKTREAYLSSQNYICERCGGAACLVHHIEHITPRNVSNADITLHWDNLKAVCDDCHALEHAADYKRRGRPARLNGIAFDEDGNAIKQPNVFLVCGSPGSGKSTYVAENKGADDLVVDLDYICAALMGEVGGVHLEHDAILSVALEVRDLLYSAIRERRGKWERAFVVTSIAEAQETKAIADDLRAEVVLIDTPLPECLRRIRSDPSRRAKRRLFERLATEWHETFSKAHDGAAYAPHVEKNHRSHAPGGGDHSLPLHGSAYEGRG